MRVSGKHPERRQSIYCRSCGYELLHLPAGRCPECGSAFDPEDLHTVTITPPVVTDPAYRMLFNGIRLVFLYGLAGLFLLAIILALVMLIGNALGLVPYP